MRVLQIGSDRSKRGILYAGSPACVRQAAYGARFGALDIIGFSLRGDGRKQFAISPQTHVYPTNSFSKLLYGLDTLRILNHLPKADIISAQDPFEVGLLALLISCMEKIPLHVQVHTDFLSPEYGSHSLVNRLRSMVAKFVLQRASHVRVVSERVKNEITARYELKVPVSVLPIYVDIERFKNVPHSPELSKRFAHCKTKLLVVSRLESEKNVSLAIASFANTVPADTCLIVVGTGSERLKLIDLAKSLGVEDQVFFEGESDPREYHSVADLVLVTSRYEGYGIVIIEALAAGKPVISTDVGIAREAGATIANEESFPAALAEWIKSGPREMHLKGYPYKNFEEYVEKYCDDIVASTKS